MNQGVKEVKNYRRQRAKRKRNQGGNSGIGDHHFSQGNQEILAEADERLRSSAELDDLEGFEE